MNKKLIRLTEDDLHKIVKESVDRILKEGYYEDMYLNDYDDVECPSCGSNNVEPISAIDTHYRCLDCGEEFYLDGGWEPDWGAMRHESHKHKGKILKEIGKYSHYELMRVVSVEPNNDKPSYYGRYKIGYTYADGRTNDIGYEYSETPRKVGELFKQEFED